MTLAIYVVTVLLIATKLLDAMSTLKRVCVQQETNPFARKLMLRLGKNKAIGVVTMLACAVIIISCITALAGGGFMRSLFLVVGVAVSVVQAAVAHSNWTDSLNPITRWVLSLHHRLKW